MKKIVSLFLAAVLMFSVSSLGFTALADTNQTPAPSSTTETANTKPPSPSTVFGKRKDFSAIEKYDFSKHTTSKNQITLEESRSYKIISRVSESDSIYAGVRIKSPDYIVEMFTAIKDDKGAGILSMAVPNRSVFSRITFDKDYIIFYEHEPKIAVRINRNNNNDYTPRIEEVIDNTSTSVPGITDTLLLFAQEEPVHVFRLTIGGERYLYEYFPTSGAGFLIDTYGELCGVYSSYEKELMEFHALTTKIPANAFARPAGYKIINFDDIDNIEDLDNFFNAFLQSS